MSPRHTLSLVLGIVMVGLGAFVALRPLWVGRNPLTGQPFLDVAFALFFVLRGLMYLRSLRRPDPRARGGAGSTAP
jgi:uncharacterized protein YjeT (DUF2065 family)